MQTSKCLVHGNLIKKSTLQDQNAGGLLGNGLKGIVVPMVLCQSSLPVGPSVLVRRPRQDEVDVGSLEDS